MTFENGEITPKQVSLPERYEEPTIASMLPGEVTFTTPWSMWFDTDGNGWLATEGSLHEEPGGTAKMWVARLDIGFAVDISHLDAQWSKQHSPSGVGSKAENSEPVVALVTNDAEREIIEKYLRQLNG